MLSNNKHNLKIKPEFELSLSFVIFHCPAKFQPRNMG